jgi:hypothetical protein
MVHRHSLEAQAMRRQRAVQRGYVRRRRAPAAHVFDYRDGVEQPGASDFLDRDEQFGACGFCDVGDAEFGALVNKIVDVLAQPQSADVELNVIDALADLNLGVDFSFSSPIGGAMPCVDHNRGVSLPSYTRPGELVVPPRREDTFPEMCVLGDDSFVEQEQALHTITTNIWVSLEQLGVPLKITLVSSVGDFCGWCSDPIATTHWCDEYGVCPVCTFTLHGCRWTSFAPHTGETTELITPILDIGLVVAETTEVETGGELSAVLRDLAAAPGQAHLFMKCLEQLALRTERGRRLQARDRGDRLLLALAEQLYAYFRDYAFDIEDGIVEIPPDEATSWVWLGTLVGRIIDGFDVLIGQGLM